MLRSEINRAIAEALETLDSHGIHLPAWTSWSAERWQEVGAEADELRNHGLGWNITDFGSGDFAATGLLICVIRNGCLRGDKPATTKTYAEKVFVIRGGQLTPWHFHWLKTEDLINRAGGALDVEVAWAGNDERSLSNEPVELSVDGVLRTVAAGTAVTLGPGESVTFPPRLCHQFSGSRLAARIVAGEISSLNDDAVDNCFLGMNATRTPLIEDQAPAYLLFNEYPAVP